MQQKMKYHFFSHRLVSVFLGNKMFVGVSRTPEIVDQHSYHMIHRKCLIFRKDTGGIGYDFK